MAQVAAPANDRKRVKVYELKNNDWFDRGTGFCRGIIVNQDEARIIVNSEDEPTRQLLETTISKDDGYQKQQETLIVWTDRNGTDMALSFQEPEGCAAIWDFVNEVQARLQMMAHDDGLSDENDQHEGSIMLPMPDLGNLAEVENHMRAANQTPAGREALAKFVLSENYISKLIPLVEMAEDLESIDDLHRLCSIMKILILLNDNAIVEYVVTDDVILGVVGALEYDPDFPLHKANHRQYLSNDRFKEVVKIEDPNIKKKIHYTYRLQYLKDVVLARILDDPTYSVLNSLIFFHQVDIVQHLQSDSAYLKELFGIFSGKEQNQQRQKDAVQLIQQCCNVGKSLQASIRGGLYQNFINHGLLDVLQFALKHNDVTVRVAGADVLLSLIDHDGMMVRGYIFKALQEQKKPLTDTLIELLLVEVDMGVKSNLGDAVKILLDPSALSASFDTLTRTNSEFSARMRGIGLPHNDSFVQRYYQESTRKLFQPLKNLEGRESMDNLSTSEVTLFIYLVDVLCYFLRQHYSRSKYIIITEVLGARVAQLLRCPQQILRLGALKFFRACLNLNDDYLHRQMISQDVFEPILQIVFDTMPRDNLLNSACLEFFETIKRESVLKELLKHVVTTYRDRLEAITYVDTFKDLILRYEQRQEPVSTQEVDHSFTSVESDTPSRTVNIPSGVRWGQALRDPDADEEAYFNGSDEDDDGLPSGPKSNGASPVRPLVNYPDDDGEEDEMDILTTSAPSASPLRAIRAQTSEAPETDTQQPTTPPTRISDRRRKEEEEEDELIASISSSGTKRKLPQQETSAAGLQKLRRKNSMSNAKDGAGPRKITISIPLKSNGGGVKDV